MDQEPRAFLGGTPFIFWLLSFGFATVTPPLLGPWTLELRSGFQVFLLVFRGKGGQLRHIYEGIRQRNWLRIGKT